MQLCTLDTLKEKKGIKIIRGDYFIPFCIPPIICTFHLNTAYRYRWTPPAPLKISTDLNQSNIYFKIKNRLNFNKISSVTYKMCINTSKLPVIDIAFINNL